MKKLKLGCGILAIAVGLLVILVILLPENQYNKDLSPEQRKAIAAYDSLAQSLAYELALADGQVNKVGSYKKVLKKLDRNCKGYSIREITTTFLTWKMQKTKPIPSLLEMMKFVNRYTIKGTRAEFLENVVQYVEYEL